MELCLLCLINEIQVSVSNGGLHVFVLWLHGQGEHFLFLFVAHSVLQLCMVAWFL